MPVINAQSPAADRLATLRSTPELAAWPGRSLQAILWQFDEVTLPAGRQIASAGTPCSQYVVVLEGRLAACSASGDRRVLRAGDSFGWNAMWDRGPNDASLTVESGCPPSRDGPRPVPRCESGGRSAGGLTGSARLTGDPRAEDPSSAMQEPRALKSQLAGGSGPVSADTAVADGSNFTDRGGRVLPAVSVQLVLWGGAWAGAANPSPDDVTAAFGAVLDGPYMGALDQYRGIGPGSLAGATVVSDSDPPNQFTNAAVMNLLRVLFEQGRLPEPDSADQLLYCVVMRPGITAADPNVIGEHSYFYYTDIDDLPFDLDLAQKAYFAWVLNDGTLDGMTTIFSHELVEAVTDPEGSAILGDAATCYGGGWCEIGDVCQGNIGQSNGVTVQAYWSQRDGACVIPT
jgi:hypothetical protein